jgi:hypothetical protein
MAQKRMIDKKISHSEQVANLGIKAQLLFTWSIPHADDIGLLPGSLPTLKAMIVPMWPDSQADFNGVVHEILVQKLWIPFEFMGDAYFKIPGFGTHQTLKKDRQPQTLLKIKPNRDPKKTWEALEAIGFQVEDDGFQSELEVKGSEGKKSKDNRRLERTAPQPIKIKQPGNPHIKDLMDFFYRAAKVIQHIEPPTPNFGKIGALLKKRLEVDKIEVDRIERMIIWYLTRKKRYKDGKGEWMEQYKYSPDFGVMLSDAFFSQMLSDEANALTYIRDNMDWIDKLYKKVAPNSAGFSAMRDLLAKKFSMDKGPNHE